MQLTNAQRTNLRTAIQNEPTLATAVAQGNDIAVAEWCNAPTTFIVWRTDVTARELLEAVVWTEVDGLTVGKARIFEWMQRLPVIDFGIARFRSGLSDCFGGASATVAALLPVIKRPATKAESLLANGTGSDASPARLRAEGLVTSDDVSRILRG